MDILYFVHFDFWLKFRGKVELFGNKNHLNAVIMAKEFCLHFFFLYPWCSTPMPDMTKLLSKLNSISRVPFAEHRPSSRWNELQYRFNFRTATVWCTPYTIWHDFVRVLRRNSFMEAISKINVSGSEKTFLCKMQRWKWCVWSVTNT